MTKQQLNGPHIGSRFEQMDSKGVAIVPISAQRRAFLVGRRGRDGASGGRDPDPRRSTKNVLD